MAEEKQHIEEKAGGSIFKLRRPISFEGETYAELNLDFESLTGEDVIACERQFLSENNGSTFVKETSKAYQSYIVARAAGVPVELIRKLSAGDFSRVTLRAQNFLFLSA
ncbi:phage tail assembly protein [Paenibacillus cisolokensis]|uniref:phage tail assembly protein n=1 Tax=Paenibacillus cisolokensis TaxID=1658519 RepID=UPI003D2E58B8